MKLYMKKIIYLILFPFLLCSQESILVGDVDCNGELNSEDASLILQYVTNVIDSLPCLSNMSGLTPEQLQEIISMMNEQLSINYTDGIQGNNYPTMISSVSLETMNFGDAMIYCDSLIEDGYDDWFLPNSDQLSYAVSGGCELPDERTSEPLWTTTIHHYFSSLIVNVSESGSSGVQASYGYETHECRCVRFGSQESSEISSDGSSLSNTNVEEVISMIGPMYTDDEYADLVDVDYPYGSSCCNEMYYFEALLFCSQLEYDGYDDWRIPHLQELEGWISINNDNTLPIPNYTTGSGGSFFINMSQGGYSERVSYIYINNDGNMTYYHHNDNPGLRKCFCVR